MRSGDADNLSDAELCERWSSTRDEAAAHEFVRRHRGRLEVGFRWAGLDDEGSGLADDVLVTALVKYDAEKSSIRTFLSRLFRNAMVDEYRRRGRHISVEVLVDEDDRHEFVDPRASFEEAAVSQAAIERCLERLDERERVAIALWLVNGGHVTLAELSEQLAAMEGCESGTSLATASRVRQRALAALWDCLEQGEDNDGRRQGGESGG